jgi:hypothetical protein
MAFFPGLREPFMFDTDQLSGGEAAQLKELVGTARFFELPSSVGAPQSGAMDYKEYSLSIEDDEKSHTVRLVEPVADANLANLLNFIREKVRAVRAAKRTSLTK